MSSAHCFGMMNIRAKFQTKAFNGRKKYGAHEKLMDRGTDNMTT